MRIGIDARPLQNSNRYRGIGRYADLLIRALAADAPERFRFVLYVDSKLPAPQFGIDRLDSAPTITVQPKRAASIRYVRAFVSPVSRVRPRPRDVDCLIQVDPWGGISSRVPTIAVFHDAIPLLFRQKVRLRGPRDVKAFLASTAYHGNYLATMRRYRRAVVVATISESATADYVRLIGRRADRVRQVGSAPPSLPARASGSAELDRWELQAGGFLLYVGGIDERKNITQLLRDLQTLRIDHPDLKLVVVGKEFTDDAGLAHVGWTDVLRSDPALGDAVVVTGFVDDATLGALYAQALAFAFPSRYEGFGLPVLEAMAQDCPVVCYDNSAIAEVAGDAALVVPDGEPMAPALERLLTEPGLRDRLIAAGRQQVAAFSWDDVAARMLTVLAEVEARC